MKKIKLKNSDVGKFVRVFFDDTGAKDGLLTRINSNDDFRLILLDDIGKNDCSDTSNNGAPAISLGKHISAKDCGLPGCYEVTLDF